MHFALSAQSHVELDVFVVEELVPVCSAELVVVVCGILVLVPCKIQYNLSARSRYAFCLWTNEMH